jgi:hypothetical protein
VGVVWIGLSRYHQQDDLGAVDAEYFDRVDRLAVRSRLSREPAKIIRIGDDAIS